MHRTLPLTENAMERTFRASLVVTDTPRRSKCWDALCPWCTGPRVIWFDFAILCGGPRSQNDYLWLAHRHHTLFLSKVPRMSADKASEARRFTWLIDVLYDHRVKLIVGADCPAEEVYTQGTQAGEFKRTVSRLIEMRSLDYLASPHRREDVLEMEEDGDSAADPT